MECNIDSPPKEIAIEIHQSFWGMHNHGLHDALLQPENRIQKATMPLAHTPLINIKMKTFFLSHQKSEAHEKVC